MNLTAMEFYPVFLGALGLLIGMVKFFLDRTIRQIDRRFDTLDSEVKNLTTNYVRQSECVDRRKLYRDKLT